MPVRTASTSCHNDSPRRSSPKTLRRILSSCPALGGIIAHTAKRSDPSLPPIECGLRRKQVIALEPLFEVLGASKARQLFASTPPDALGHGYLFAGPAGVGKKTFARRLAQSLLCQTHTNQLLGYCAECVSCRMFKSKTHPDYTETIGDIKIGNGSERNDKEVTARGLVRALALQPYHGNHQIAVLGDVSFATDEAANALLKFFEDPPDNVIIILTSSIPGGLLGTIRSRLIDVPFDRLDATDIATILKNEGVAADRANRAAAAASGSITAARALLAESSLNVRSIAFAWVGAAMNGGSPDLRLEDRGVTPNERRDWLTEFLECARTIMRDYAVAIVAGASAPKLARELDRHIGSLPRRSARDATAALESVAEAIRLAQTNVSPALVADYLRVGLAPTPTAR
jgi:hypothetical protein